MKKLVVLLMACLMLTSVFAGCGESNGASSNGASKEGASKDAEMKIGFTISDRDQFMSSVETAVKNKCEELGIKGQYQDAQKDVQKQIDQIKTYAEQGFDAILVIPVEAKSVEAMVDAANGVPLIFICRLLNPEDESFYEAGKVMGVGTDENQAGQLQAEYLTSYFGDKKDLTAAVLMGVMGAPNTIQRTESALAGLESEGFKADVAFQDTAEWDRAKAMEKIQNFIGVGKDLDVVISNNDEMALGAIEALKAVGKKPGEIAVVGVDATPDGCNAIREGWLNASAFQDAVAEGEGAVDLAIKVHEGETVDEVIFIPFKLVTKENVDTFQDEK
ncbi:MAG: substrate-binding domain-containing protein [Clostridiales Family XIII bacterium]|jgi:ABC-type sugar transport system substrate-binding protein|nr:substrate-binding domain-containing protein [Clostridiales Family XIII bacterium]